VIHSEQAESINEAAGKIRLIIGESLPMYIELAASDQRTHIQLLQQIERCREVRSAGIIFSSVSDLSDEQLRLLRIGPFRNSAQPPTEIKMNANQ
jgi:hypothetical protein